MLALMYSWAQWATSTAALLAAGGALPRSLAAARALVARGGAPLRRAAAAALVAAWLAAFRKNAPLVWHVRGFIELAARAAAALARGRGLAQPGDAYTTRHTCLLGDLDAMLHQNNAIYATEIDIQRFGFLVDLFAGYRPYALPLLRWGWKLANGGVCSFFYKEIRLHAAYDIRTRVAGVDAKWFYLRSDHVGAGGVLHATSITRVVVKTGRLTVPPRDALARLGYAPADIAALLASGAPRGAPLDDVAVGPAISAVGAFLAGAGSEPAAPAAAPAAAKKAA